MEAPLGFLLKLPPAMIVVPIVLKIAYLIGFLLALATCGVGIAWGVYTAKKDKDKKEKFKKATMGTGISALIILVICTIIDFLFVSGLPPQWWPEGGDANGNDE
jgi:DMSO/TMAO reductase YedYZ heme-binding membrane subunit